MKYKETELSLTKVISDMEEKYGKQRTNNILRNITTKEVAEDIADIKDYRKVFELIKKLQEDIYTDTMYPNDLRPETNHGYTTKYKGLD